MLTLPVPARAEGFFDGVLGRIMNFDDLLDDLIADFSSTPSLPGGITIDATEASRIFAGPDQYPPADFAAYGILAFRSRATSFDIARHKLICEAYVSAIPHYTELDIPLSRQMVTVWPIDTSAHADATNAAPRAAVCDRAVADYGLVTARRALADAEATGADFSGQGPFLLAWSPAGTKGRADALVLTADLSHVSTIEQAKDVFETWVSDIEENPELWEKGWDIEKLRLTIRDWLDRFGGDILKLAG